MNVVRLTLRNLWWKPRAVLENFNILLLVALCETCGIACSTDILIDELVNGLCKWVHFPLPSECAPLLILDFQRNDQGVEKRRGWKSHP